MKGNGRDNRSERSDTHSVNLREIGQEKLYAMNWKPGGGGGGGG